MKTDYKAIWKEIANNKSNTVLHHIQYCALKALYAKRNNRKEIAEALVRRAFTPRHDTDWSSAKNAARKAFYTSYILGIKKTDFFENEAEMRRYNDIVYTLAGSNLRDNEPDYLFIFVRQDISREQQAVQAAHATFVAGAKFTHKSPEQVYFVLIGVEDEIRLADIARMLEERETAHVLFREPDLDNSITAIATAPMKEHQKRFLKHFKKLEF